MPEVDHTKVVYYSGFNAYKNLNVYDATISVIGDTIAAGATKAFSTVITVPEVSNYATIQIQANESVGTPPRTPSTLRWQQYPAAKIISIALGTDPDGSGTLDCFFYMKLNGDEVTFTVQATNPSGSSISLVPTDIGVRYAIHSTLE